MLGENQLGVEITSVHSGGAESYTESGEQPEGKNSDI